MTIRRRLFSERRRGAAGFGAELRNAEGEVHRFRRRLAIEHHRAKLANPDRNSEISLDACPGDGPPGIRTRISTLKRRVLCH